MKVLVVSIAVLAVAVLGASDPPFQCPPAPTARPLAIDAVVTPSVQSESVYRVAVEIRDAASGKLLSSPSVTLQAGSNANMHSKTAYGEWLHVDVDLNSDASMATLSARLVDRFEREYPLGSLSLRVLQPSRPGGI